MGAVLHRGYKNLETIVGIYSEWGGAETTGEVNCFAKGIIYLSLYSTSVMFIARLRFKGTAVGLGQRGDDRGRPRGSIRK